MLSREGQSLQKPEDLIKDPYVFDFLHKLKPADIGQLNAYLNYFKAEINETLDNEPIGIVLCADKDEIVAEYALGGLTNQIFASKYVYYLPNKEELIRQVEMTIKEMKNIDI